MDRSIFKNQNLLGTGNAFTAHTKKKEGDTGAPKNFGQRNHSALSGSTGRGGAEPSADGKFFKPSSGRLLEVDSAFALTTRFWY